MDKRDYEEPMCPMDNSMWVKKNVTPIPADRVCAKEDEYLAQNDFAGAERHLLYWWAEAEQGNDERGKLVLCNELMGLNRKIGQGEKAVSYAQKALDLVAELGLQGTIAGSTAYLNAGTVYKAFAQPEKSLECFEKARAVYESTLDAKDSRKAGLYNNMALTLADLGRFAEAKELYMAAIDIVKDINKADEAISWLNLADLAVAERGLEAAEGDIQNYLDKASLLLDSIPENERGGYYAFVCEKCAPVFDYYGYFAVAADLKNRAETIYKNNSK